VMEALLQPLMYEIPSDPTVERVVVTASCVTQGAAPQVERNPVRMKRKVG